MQILGFEINLRRAKHIEVAEAAKKTVSLPEGEMPVSGGRSSSADTGVSALDLLREAVDILSPEFYLEFITAIEHLAKYNHDVSFALENIVQLSNTEYTIYFESSVSAAQVKKMRAEISSVSSAWFNNGAGIHALRNALLVQAAVGGAVSAEAVIQPTIDGIKKVVLVNPKNIRFKHDKAKDEYIPHQKLVKNINTNGPVDNLIPLNPVTYKYRAMRQFNSSPYGIPPFLSALESIAIEKHMIESFRYIIEKFGVMGFMSVLLSKPSVAGTPGQMSPTEMEAKAQRKLDAAAAEVEKGIKKGFVVGFKGDHEFHMENTAVDAAGVEKLMRLNAEMKMSGLKQDPLMLGRNYSTTEAIGRVILGKLSAQLTNYQLLVDGFLADIFHLHLLLKGYAVKQVTVESVKPMITDEVKDQTAFTMKIANADSLYNQGVISQEQRSQMLGWDTPDQTEPRYPPLGVNLDHLAEGAAADNKNPTKKGAAGDKKKQESNSHTPPSKRPMFRYGSRNEQLAQHRNAEVSSYAEDLVAEYHTAAERLSALTVKALIALPALSSLADIEDSVLHSIYTNFESRFGDKQGLTITNYLRSMYRTARQDSSIFGKGASVPEAAMTTRDFAIIDYYRQSDGYYISKFITDSDTKQRILNYIRAQYVEGNIPATGETRDILEEGLADVLKDESWKLERIVHTTATQLTNAAALMYMSQAGIEQFKVVGHASKTQCGHCAEMDGRTFSVKTALSRLELLTTSDPADVGSVRPFVSELYKSAGELAGVDDEALQASGIDLPSYHANCTCSVTAA